MMETGTKIKLVSFNGETETPKGCDSAENYWALIGSTGKVIEPVNTRGRVLVQFDMNVSDKGLHSHNKIPNTLLILPSDLKVN